VKTNHHHDDLHLFQARIQDRGLELNLTELAEAGWFAPDALPADLGRYVRPILKRVTRA